jgi:hypothetical protein
MQRGHCTQVYVHRLSDQRSARKRRRETDLFAGVGGGLQTKDTRWVTQATISSSACIKDFTDACNKITSTIPGLSDLGRKGCIKANTIDSFYHLNWSVYAMRIECPEHLTQVTGCRLAPQGLKSAKKDVKTADQAKADADFWKKTANTEQSV